MCITRINIIELFQKQSQLITKPAIRDSGRDAFATTLNGLPKTEVPFMEYLQTENVCNLSLAKHRMQ